jgi:hypothetical protein
VYWIELAQDKDMCQAVVNRYGTLGFHKMQGLYPLALEISASEEGLCCMELANYDNLVVN